ncbi:hypothetical protein DAEQUDRAFT_448449 [Daedalea quercina L-15889]|uniref:DUF6535 domain-containing protein n=1 Tax=Daedalea quercina L-15889 TaxID=1314783 RepID=A0A165N5Z5_9APHY|nr:hypothetical protein DAEQUDRAFT_448449 [Daedalea quercina L-15889]
MASLNAQVPADRTLYHSHYRRLASSSDQDVIIHISSSGDDLSAPLQNQPFYSSENIVDPQSRRNTGYRPNDPPNARNATLTSDTSNAWTICAEEVWKHEEATVQNWKEEIDTMLVFAGLFSAIVATFNAQYYLNLQPSSQPVTPGIYILLANMTVLPGGTEHLSGTINATAGGVPGTAIAVNALWFSALVFSLAAASIGISVKQWLEHYVVPQSIVPRQRAQMWHSRRRGLLDWRVPEIITLIPILLQIALALFLVGMQLLLWTMSAIVAGIVLAPTALLLAFTIYTMIVPTVASDCPYRSPQAWRIYQALRRIAQLFTLVSRFGFLTGWRTFLFAGKATKPWSTWIEREKAKLRHLGKGEESLDVLVSADKFIGGDIFLEQVVKPCLIQADIHSALPIFYRILQERAHLVDRTVGQTPMPKWLADEMDNGSVILMGHLALEMLCRVGTEGGEGDRLRDEPRILDLLARLLPATPVADGSVYERLIAWFIGADLSPESRKGALALILRNAPKFLPDHPELCVSLGHMCLDTVEQLHRDGSDPQASRQRSVLQALDHVLFATPETESSVFDRLCRLLPITGIYDGAGDEMADIVYRYSGHFSSSESNIHVLSTCMRPLQDEDNPVPGMSLLSAILAISARLPAPDVDLIENALHSATGNASPDTVVTIAQKMDSKSAWWVVCRLVDGCIAIAKRDVQLLPLGAFGALESLVSLCDAESYGNALFGIRQRLWLLRDVLEGRPAAEEIMDVDVLANRPSTAHSIAARRQLRSYSTESLVAIQ